MAGWASRCTLCQVPASWQITLAARTDNRLFFRLQTRSSGLFFSSKLIPHFLPWQPWSIDLQAFKSTAKRICLRTVHKACVKINWIFKGASGRGQCQRKDKLTVWIGNEAKRFFSLFGFPLVFIPNGLWSELVIRVVIPSEDDDHHEEGTWRLEPGSGPLRQISLGQSESSWWWKGPMREERWRGTGIIWSILPNYVSFDGEFYDNDSPNMSNVPQAGSDLTVDLSSPIYFIPQRAFIEANLLPNFLSLLSLNLWWYGVNFPRIQSKHNAAGYLNLSKNWKYSPSGLWHSQMVLGWAQWAASQIQLRLRGLFFIVLFNLSKFPSILHAPQLHFIKRSPLVKYCKWRLK